MDITPFLNRALAEPLYRQLYHWLKIEIEAGRLVSGTKLPSIRQLMLHLKISRNTVEAAYQQLQAEGYVESRPKSGIWVAEIERIVPHVVALEKEVATSFEQVSDGVIDFEYGNVDVDKFPLKQWRKCLSEVMERRNDWLFRYGDRQGEWGLRQQISTYLLQARGIETMPEQIIITAGTQSSIALICDILALRGERVAMEEPGYSGVRAVFAKEACELVDVPLEQDGLCVDAIAASRAKAVYVTPSHQFPLGMVLPVSKRLRLLHWAYDTGSYLIEDDYDSEWRYQGKPIPSLKSLDEKERVIYLGTFSKSFLPSMRLSYIVCPPSLLERYQQNQAAYHQEASAVLQLAMAQFMESGEFERHIRRTRKLYQKKHQTLLGSIAEYMGARVEVIGEKSGLHILLKIHGISSARFIEKGLQKGVRVYCPSRFWASDKPSDGYIMLGFGGLSNEEIEEGIRLLASCLPS